MMHWFGRAYYVKMSYKAVPFTLPLSILTLSINRNIKRVRGSGLQSSSLEFSLRPVDWGIDWAYHLQ